MCDCISRVNKKLEPTGMELPVSLVHVDNTFQLSLSIPLIRIDGDRIKKTDTNKIMPTYCPFCGVKIDMIAEAKRLHEEYAKPTLTTLADRRLMETPGMVAGRQEVEGQDERD